MVSFIESVTIFNLKPSTFFLVACAIGRSAAAAATERHHLRNLQLIVAVVARRACLVGLVFGDACRRRREYRRHGHLHQDRKGSQRCPLPDGSHGRRSN